MNLFKTSERERDGPNEFWEGVVSTAKEKSRNFAWILAAMGQDSLFWASRRWNVSFSAAATPVDWIVGGGLIAKWACFGWVHKLFDAL